MLKFGKAIETHDFTLTILCGKWLVKTYLTSDEELYRQLKTGSRYLHDFGI